VALKAVRVNPARLENAMSTLHQPARIMHVVVLCVGAILASPARVSADDYFQIVYDTSPPSSPEYRADFGYAVFVQFDGKRVLLDTGTDSSVLKHNLAAAGVDLGGIDAVVMTHNHHDHAGGLRWVREQNPRVPVYVPPGQDYGIGGTRVVTDTLALTRDLVVIRGHADVPTGGISDDLSLAMRTADGLYVLNSCSHSGVAAIVDRAAAVMGGQVTYYSSGARLAYRDASDTTVVSEALAARGVKRVAPSHCSLSHAVMSRMRETLGGALVPSSLGERVPLP
jgi:7,8-dihydropterin-6-yl-methyl-4-(beta-D-ribofuranosyl)aminobenzene 5'-phosphate synthase